MAANGISTLATKQARQAAKLELAKLKRQGYTLDTDGSVLSGPDITQPFYRTRHDYVITQLPTKYAVGDNFTGNIVDNANTGGLILGRPWVAYSFTTIPTSINEGSSGTFYASTVYVEDNTTLYWTIETHAEDFTVTSGSFTVTDNVGSFALTPTADVTTEGPEAFTVAIRSGSTSGPILTTSDTVTITEPNGSIEFNGSNYLSLASDAAFGFGTGDFTIEGWYYHTAGGANHRLFDFRDTEPQLAPMLGIGSVNQIYLYVNGSNRIIGSTLALNTWTHITVVKQTNSTKLYINGTNSGSTYADTNDYGTARQLTIGADYQHSNKYVGLMSNLRVVKGVAVYTGNFTTPNAPLFAIQSSGTNISAIVALKTQLLLSTFNNTTFADDSSTNHFAITNSGSVTGSSSNPF